MECKAKADVEHQHLFILLSAKMAALFQQGRVAFGNTEKSPASPKAHLPGLSKSV
jgi:hypothetical protein